MKYVYVLVSSEKDYYYEQLYISLISLRKYHPYAYVILLTDDKTEKNMVGFRKEIKKLIQEMIVENFYENLSAKARSGILKSSMRSLVKGDFLYIDLDTVIVEPLENLDILEADVMMALDLHTKIPDYCYYRRLQKNANLMGYSMGYEDAHYNSGVIYAKDNDNAKKLFELWRKLYKETIQKGLEMDQLALNEANARLHGVIKELDGIWNVQITCGLRYLSRAKIIHYLGYTQPSNKQKKYMTTLPFLLCDERILKNLKQKGKITSEIEKILEKPKESFKTVTIIANDSVVYPLIFSNHMRFFKFWYVNCRSIYDFMELVFDKLFWLVFKRA